MATKAEQIAGLEGLLETAQAELSAAGDEINDLADQAAETQILLAEAQERADAFDLELQGVGEAVVELDFIIDRAKDTYANLKAQDKGLLGIAGQAGIDGAVNALDDVFGSGTFLPPPEEIEEEESEEKVEDEL